MKKRTVNGTDEKFCASYCTTGTLATGGRIDCCSTDNCNGNSSDDGSITTKTTGVSCCYECINCQNLITEPKVQCYAPNTFACAVSNILLIYLKIIKKKT